MSMIFKDELTNCGAGTWPSLQRHSRSHNIKEYSSKHTFSHCEVKSCANNFPDK